jgi:hypothetical protein
MHTARFWTTIATLILGLTATYTTVAAPAETATTETIPVLPLFGDRFIIEFGGYYSKTGTQASLSGARGGVGVLVDFENALGLEERNLSGIVGFVWRMTDRWRLDIEYFGLNRSATKTLATQVDWGDQTFLIGTTVDATYNFYDTRVSAGYSFFKQRDKELGIGLGLHVAGIKASVQSTTGGVAEGGDVLAPLPVLNLYGSFALTDEWALRLRMDWLSLTYGDYTGDVRSMAIDVHYQPFRHVGFGLGMRNLVLDLTIDDPHWSGRVRMVYMGPTAVMTVSF